ncbi:MAG: hypothetical protein AAF202_10240 [Pseudomonadota bacterium]
MKVTTLKCLLLSVLAAGLVACDRGTIDSDLLAEDENGNNNIHRTYRVDFSEESNRSLASATFAVGGSWGTTVRLVKPASIQIDGTRALENTDVYDQEEKNALALGFLFPPAWLFAGASGTTYHQVIPGNAGSVAFEFIDNSGTRFYDTAKIPNVGLSLNRTASMNGFQVSLHGDTREARVTVRLSQGREYESVSGEGSSVFIHSSDLEGFVPGQAKIQVVVRYSDRIRNDSKSLGGMVSTSYTFSQRNIELR